MIDLDTLPVNWNFVFQMTCVISIGVILWNIKQSDILDQLRHPEQVKGLLFTVRRGSKFVMALGLCWLVIYAHERAWTAWPPFIIFLLSFDVLQITHILVMKQDTKKREVFEGLLASAGVQRLRGRS